MGSRWSRGARRSARPTGSRGSASGRSIHTRIATSADRPTRLATIDINHGKMNGFIAAARQSSPCRVPTDAGCAAGAGIDVMGYHDVSGDPELLGVRENFVLQDRMFEPVAASSLSSHLSLGLRMVCGMFATRGGLELSQ